MPEGDTVYLAGRRLHAALSGKTLTGSDFRVPRYATADLKGRTVTDVSSRGKHLMFHLDDDLTLHTHFKMQGAWHIYRPGGRWRSPAFEARVVLEVHDVVAVGFRLPVVELLEPSREVEVVGHLGPDLLGPDWDADEALRRMSLDPERPIGDVLVDQTVMAGLGNVYRCEICFLRGAHPSTPIARISDLDGWVALAKRSIEANRSTGSQIMTGDSRPGRGQWVYGRGGRPCLRCGTKIERAAPIEGRVTYWCPSCQS